MATGFERTSTMYLRALGTTLVLVACGAWAGAQTNGEAILDAILDAQRGGEAMRGTITMTVARPDQERVYVIEMVSDGDERSLIRVVEPSRDAGQAFLRDGDNLYVYSPRLRRTLRLPPSGRSDTFLGSDLSYGDLAGRDLANDYAVSVTAETDDTVELTLTPLAGAPTPYGQVVLVADATTYAPVTYTFFDQREQAVRLLRFDDYVAVGELRFPTHIEIENLLRPGERTTMVIDDHEFGIDVPDGCFTERALERGC